MSETFFPASLIIKQQNIDLETMRHYAYKWGVEREQTQKGFFSTSMNVVHTPNIQLGYAYYSHGVMRKGDLPKGAILLGFVIGKESTIFENSRLEDNELIFLDDGEDMDIFSNNLSEMFIVVIEKELFFSSFYTYFDKSLKDVLKNKHLIIEKEKIKTFAQELKSWMEYLQSKKFLKMQDKPYSDIELNLLRDIFKSIDFETRAKERSKFQVKKVRDLLHESISEKISITDIMKEVDISERQLYNSFKSNYGVTPKKYLQHLRLNAARKELLLADPKDISISDIAFKYGFSHMSYFTSEYKKMFFTLPSQDLQKN